MRKDKRSIFWGIIIILVGALFLGNTCGWWNVNIFFEGWWTLFIIVPSLLGIFKKGMFVTSVLGILLGSLLLLASQDVIAWTKVLKMFFPILIIIIGISFLFKPALNKKLRKKFQKKGSLEYLALFASSEEIINSDFNGATCTAIFGTLSLDLNKANIKEDVIIDCISVFGGIDFNVPDDVKIVTSGTPLFGGIENKKIDDEESKKTIYINYICAFSGIKII